MGVLTENWIKRTCCAVWFPYPIKVTGVSYTLENFQADSRSVFPSPLEVNGGSYQDGRPGIESGLSFRPLSR